MLDTHRLPRLALCAAFAVSMVFGSATLAGTDVMTVGGEGTAINLYPDPYELTGNVDASVSGDPAAASLMGTDTMDSLDYPRRTMVVAENTGQAFVINQGVSDAWFTYDTERPPEGVIALLGEPGHRWVTAQGPYDGDTATLTVYLTEGGVFDMAEPPAKTDTENPIGTITIVWHDCESATLTYDIDPPGVSGEIALRRIVPDNAMLCEALMGE